MKKSEWGHNSLRTCGFTYEPYCAMDVDAVHL